MDGRRHCHPPPTAAPTPEVSIVAHRPTTAGLRDAVVPDGEDRDPGVGIRRNGDDDDNNGVPDRDDLLIAKDDDLLKVELGIQRVTGHQYFLKRDNENVRVYRDSNKGLSLLFNNNEAEVPEVVSEVWVEWRSLNAADTRSKLTLDARQAGNVVKQDLINLYPFNSIIVGFVGEFTNRSAANEGVNQIVFALRNQGYDAQVFDEGDANDAPGKGGPIDAQAETLKALNGRGVVNVAIFGHSHGGGATFNLAQQLNRRLAYTAYIDAIQQPFANTLPEKDRPLKSDYHVNLFQTTGAIHGAAMGAEADEDIDVRTNHQWLLNVTHSTIDNDARVQAHIKTGITTKVPQK